MPHQTRWEEHGIYWHYSGIVDHDEVLQSNYEFYNDQRADNAQYQLVDCSGVEAFNVRELTLDALAALDKASSQYLHQLNVALVSSDKQVQRLYRNYIEAARRLDLQWQIAVFDDQPSARAWLAQQASQQAMT